MINILAFAVAQVVLAGGLVVTVPQAVASTPESFPASRLLANTDSAASNSDQAALRARLNGTPIEDLSQRDEFTQVFANPDGTWTAQTAPDPVRVNEDGTWQDVDLTLVEVGNTIAPEHSPTDLTLDGGAGVSFATAALDGQDVSWEWPGGLPEPDLDGSTATYSNVAENTDLVVTALSTGFTYHFVLNERPSKPVSLSVPVSGEEKITGQQDINGAISLRSADGNNLATAPEPLMWEGNGAAGSTNRETRVVDTTVTNNAAGRPVVTLVPDMQYLSSPATEYPVVVDPTFTTFSTGDAWIQNTGDTTAQVTDAELRVGTNNGGVTKSRSYLRFGNGDSLWNGKKILSADLILRNWYSTSCAAGAIRASRIRESWSLSGLSWSTKPNLDSNNSDTVYPALGASGCPDGEARWNVTSIVQDWANGTYANNGIALTAVNETLNSTWRKYRSANYETVPQRQPKISVTYNSYPAIPNGLNALESNPSGAGFVTSTLRPTLSSMVSDPDPGTSAASFEIRSGSTVVMPFTNGLGTFSGDQSSSLFRVPTGTLQTGETYQVYVRGTDGSLVSNFSAPMTLTVDSTAPTPAVVSSVAYPSDSSWNGNVGTAGVFTVTNSNSAITKYRVWFGASQYNLQSSAGNPASVSLTPTQTGRNVVYAATVDAQGNVSQRTAYSFLVGDLSASSTPDLVDKIVQEQFANVVTGYDPQDPSEDAVDALYKAGQLSLALPSASDEVDEVPTGFTEPSDPLADYNYLQETESDTLTLPANAAGSIIQLGSSSLQVASIDLPGSAASSAASGISGDVVAYPNSLPGVDTVAYRTGDDDVSTFQLLRTSAAAKTFEYTPALAAGQTVDVVPADGVAVISDNAGNPMNIIDASFAQDSSGAVLSSTLSKVGNALRVTLSSTTGIVKFPAIVEFKPLAISGYKPGDATPSERAYCFGHPKACYQAQKDSGKATNSADYRYAAYSNSLYRGAGDAYRHCYWNARMELHISHTSAYEFATRHESESSGNDKAMDLFNNKFGRSVGRSKESTSTPVGSSIINCQIQASSGANTPDPKLKMVGPWLCESPRPPSSSTSMFWSELPEKDC